MDVRLRVVDASVGFRTFFDSVSFRLLRDAAKIIQENHYYPFGQNMVGIEEKDQQSTSAQEEQKFQYNAKEKLDEFGLYWNDHGARNLDLQTGRWTTVDPLAESTPRWSPYTYGFNNPLRFIDPKGMSNSDVIITGDKAKEAFKQLQQSTSLKLKMDDNGKVTASGKAKTPADEKLLEATMINHNVVVQIDATSSDFTESGYWYVGGAYGGSAVGKDGKTYTTQTVNPEMTGKIDEFYGAEKGVSMMHEVLESFIGGVDSKGVGAPVLGDETTPEFKAYLSAHNKADIVDPRHIAPTLSRDETTGHFYIERPHPFIPGLTEDLLINDLSKKR